MISVENTVLILLAAGQSRRFGDVGSKLTEPFLGRELGLHVAVALESMPFMERLAIVDGGRIDYTPHGFTQLHNHDPGEGMSKSVKIGVQRARELGANAVLIALADMPRVTATHIYRLYDAVDGMGAVVASSDGREPRPPALFGRDRFDELLALTGEHGASQMIKAGRHVVTAPAELIDVDTPEELEQLRALVHAPEAITRAGARRSD
ncbi:nucleotidyltransferase family protein [Sphingomonas mollis]|uniref:Nucleotidyltransferase family protein n=1 Tax=Sphingomonas mollis TaxID=2795726 RepID=A0ABS0XSP3_9SPHN|nr:nucleotidyltransferase family protein [Sphingomonas sp. BT553]MBJ6123034.1 nucleotidyltransferase family protein [Sphingomonas sp. BT553]